MNEVTNIIHEIQGGDQQAIEKLLPLVYDELRRLAASRMDDERKNHTLSPTALVHEAYLKLTGKLDDVEWSGKGHFFAAAADAMQRILIDHARQKNALKRGGGAKQIEFDDALLFDSKKTTDLLQLDDSLTRLEGEDAEAAKLVKLRFFAGMTNQQAAKQLSISSRKANMLWAFARAWLKRDMLRDQ